MNNDKYFEKIIQREGTECYKRQNKYIKCYSLEEIIRNILIVIPFALAIIKSIYDLSNGIVFNMSIKDNLCLNKKLSDNEIEIYLRELEYK